MQTITLTDFNQNPSRATRLADDDEVLILRRGTAAYRLVRVEGNQSDPVAALVQTGILTPPRATTRKRVRRTATASSDLGATLEADRDRLGH
ncbi:hypothetical protein GCM10011575_29520 [Microlunatus endophyticus]|uniref:Uncharacterized protein n=1 Tax=Microlunatus endophyticus TaxID=1716077 RepID=A0A917W6P7_9ACTN|nr:type II toxin-antitoxin system Phd/YefM family antitoxin [Microlunatus endophyticus]GGL68968.1 hypothetical protein GCM10011575_29520 [Microlunatus endophyticus]